MQDTEVKTIKGMTFQVRLIQGVRKYLVNGRSVRKDVYISALTEAVR